MLNTKEAPNLTGYSPAQIFSGEALQNHPESIYDITLPLAKEARVGLSMRLNDPSIPLFVSCRSKECLLSLGSLELVHFLRFVGSELNHHGEPILKLANTLEKKKPPVIPNGGVVMPSNLHGLKRLMDNQRFISGLSGTKAGERVRQIKDVLSAADRQFTVEIIDQNEFETGRSLGTLILRSGEGSAASMQRVKEYFAKGGKLLVKFQNIAKPDTMYNIRLISEIIHGGNEEWIDDFLADVNYRPTDGDSRHYREKTGGGSLLKKLKELRTETDGYLKVEPLDGTNGELKKVLEEIFTPVRAQYSRSFLNFTLSDDEARDAKKISYLLPALYILTNILENSGHGDIASLLIFLATDLFNDIQAGSASRIKHNLNIQQVVRERLPAIGALGVLGLTSAELSESFIQNGHNAWAAAIFGGTILGSGLVSLLQSAWMGTRREINMISARGEKISNLDKFNLFQEHFMRTLDNPVLLSMLTMQVIAFLSSIGIAAGGIYDTPAGRGAVKTPIGGLESFGAVFGSRFSSDIIRWRVRRHLQSSFPTANNVG